MPRGVNIGTTTYPTKEAVRDVCRGIVQRYGIDGDITDPADDAFLRKLLEHHPDYELKRGAGIAHFRVIPHPRYGHRSVGLGLVRLDGSGPVDWSWNECLSVSSHRSQVLAALRHAVADQVRAARDAVLSSGRPLVCAVTGTPIPLGELHMDHAAPTFLELAERFTADNGGMDAFQILPDSGLGVMRNLTTRNSKADGSTTTGRTPSYVRF